MANKGEIIASAVVELPSAGAENAQVKNVRKKLETENKQLKAETARVESAISERENLIRRYNAAVSKQGHKELVYGKSVTNSVGAVMTANKHSQVLKDVTHETTKELIRATDKLKVTSKQFLKDTRDTARALTSAHKDISETMVNGQANTERSMSRYQATASRIMASINMTVAKMQGIQTKNIAALTQMTAKLSASSTALVRAGSSSVAKAAANVNAVSSKVLLAPSGGGPIKPPTMISAGGSGGFHGVPSRAGGLGAGSAAFSNLARRKRVSLQQNPMGGLQTPLNVQTLPEALNSLTSLMDVLEGKRVHKFHTNDGRELTLDPTALISHKDLSRLNSSLASVMSDPSIPSSAKLDSVVSMHNYIQSAIEQGQREMLASDRRTRTYNKTRRHNATDGSVSYLDKSGSVAAARMNLSHAVSEGAISPIEGASRSRQLDMVESGTLDASHAATLNNQLTTERNKLRAMHDRRRRYKYGDAYDYYSDSEIGNIGQSLISRIYGYNSARFLDFESLSAAQQRNEISRMSRHLTEKMINPFTGERQNREQLANSARSILSGMLGRGTIDQKAHAGILAVIDNLAMSNPDFIKKLSPFASMYKSNLNASKRTWYVPTKENPHGEAMGYQRLAMEFSSMAKTLEGTYNIRAGFAKSADSLIPSLGKLTEENIRPVVSGAKRMNTLRQALESGNAYRLKNSLGGIRTLDLYGKNAGVTMLSSSGEKSTIPLERLLSQVYGVWGLQQGYSQSQIKKLVERGYQAWGLADVSTSQGRRSRRAIISGIESMLAQSERGFIKDAVEGTGKSLRSARSLFSNEKDYAAYRGNIERKAGVIRQRQNSWAKQVESLNNALGRLDFKDALKQVALMRGTNPGLYGKAIGSTFLGAATAVLKFSAAVTAATTYIIARLARGQMESADARTSIRNMYNIGVPTGWRTGDYSQFERSSFANARRLRIDAYDYQNGVLGLATALRGVGDSNGNPLIRNLSEVERMYTNLTMMSRASGVNEADFNGIMVQLLQGIGKGKLDMQDIKPMLSRSGVMSDLLARYAFGLSGRGELFTELERGRGDRSKGLTAERLVSGLLSENLTKVMDNVMRSSARTWGEVMTVVKSDLKEAVLPITSVFSDNSAAGVGSRILGLSQELAEDKVVGGELQFGEALRQAIFGNASIDVVDLVNKGFHAFGVMVDAAVLVMHVGRTVLLAAEYIKTVLGSMLGVIQSVLGVVSVFIGFDTYLASKMSGGDDTVLGKLFGSMSDGLGEAGQALWKSGTSMWKSNALEAADATRVAMDIDNMLEHGSAVADALKNTNLTGKNTAEDTPSDISSIVANTNETAKGVNEIKKNTTKMTEVQIALLKQVSGQTIVNRVSNIRPNIVANVGTIKSGVELDELIDKISDGVSREIAAYAY